MDCFNKERFKKLAGIKTDKPSQKNNHLNENFRMFGMASPGTIGSFDNEDYVEDEADCNCADEKKEEITEISLSPSQEEIRHIEHVEFELMEEMKIIISKLETIGDYDNLDKAIELLQSMNNLYSEN